MNLSIFSLLWLSTLNVSAQIALPMFKRLNPAASYVQTAEKYNSSGSTTAMTTAYSSALTTGNTIVCVVFQPTAQSVSSVTDTNSNTYTLAYNTSSASCSSGTSYSIFYATNITGAGSGVKTKATFSASASVSGISCHEFSNLASSPFDAAGFSTSAATTTSISAGPAVNNYTKELVIAYISANQVPSAGSGFTSISSIVGNLIEYGMILSTGSTPITASVSPASCYDVIWSTFRSK